VKELILKALSHTEARINKGFPIDREADFQTLMCGELYKLLPEQIIRQEFTLSRSYQSYSNANAKKKLPSRVDFYLEDGNRNAVIELKYFASAGSEYKQDQLGDIAKVERIVEAGEADEGFCIQLVKVGVEKLLFSGEVNPGTYEQTVGKINYKYEIKGQYEINHVHLKNGLYCVTFHHIQKQ
jgi:hypothetical protein